MYYVHILIEDIKKSLPSSLPLSHSPFLSLPLPLFSLPTFLPFPPHASSTLLFSLLSFLPSLLHPLPSPSLLSCSILSGVGLICYVQGCNSTTCYDELSTEHCDMTLEPQHCQVSCHVIALLSLANCSLYM